LGNAIFQGRIDRNGQIVLTMPYVEMGQGTYTSIPMLIAEELEVNLKQMQVEHAPPNILPYLCGRNVRRLVATSLHNGKLTGAQIARLSGL
jgi:CO/xanthine dehydrogenase Mo-binding subunit